MSDDNMESHKKQYFTLFLEATFLENPQEVGHIDLFSLFRFNRTESSPNRSILIIILISSVLIHAKRASGSLGLCLVIFSF